mgnify:FL=1
MTGRGALCPSTWGSACRRSAPAVPTVLIGRVQSMGRGTCAWPALGGAVVCEDSATLALRQALNQPSFYAVVGLGYALNLIVLSLTFLAGMPLGVAYGGWSAGGAAVTAIASRLLFGELLTRAMMTGIALIVTGVLLVEVGSAC